jgi:hypothetical protein
VFNLSLGRDRRGEEGGGRALESAGFSSLTGRLVADVGPAVFPFADLVAVLLRFRPWPLFFISKRKKMPCWILNPILSTSLLVG